MKNMLKWSLWAVVWVVAVACNGQAPGVKKVEAADALALLKAGGIQVLDVRTPEEVSKGVLKGAQVYDYNAGQVPAAIKALDKTKPVLVYCYAGGRSADAASELAKAGFTAVYDLKGGMRAWSAANYEVVLHGAAPAAKASTAPKVNSAAVLEKALVEKKPVLIDFYAPWCGPCKKMEPILAQLVKDHPDVLILRVNTDEEKEIASAYKVQELPTVITFKKGKQEMRAIGYQGKEQLEKLIKDIR